MIDVSKIRLPNLKSIELVPEGLQTLSLYENYTGMLDTVVASFDETNSTSLNSWDYRETGSLESRVDAMGLRPLLEWIVALGDTEARTRLTRVLPRLWDLKGTTRAIEYAFSLTGILGSVFHGSIVQRQIALGTPEGIEYANSANLSNLQPCEVGIEASLSQTEIGSLARLGLTTEQALERLLRIMSWHCVTIKFISISLEVPTDLNTFDQKVAVADTIAIHTPATQRLPMVYGMAGIYGSGYIYGGRGEFGVVTGTNRLQTSPIISLVGTTPETITVTQDPNNTESTLVLSNGDLTVTGGASANSSSRATKFNREGKWYWETNFDSQNLNSDVIIGIVDSNNPISEKIGFSKNSWGVDKNLLIYNNDAFLTTFTPSFSISGLSQSAALSHAGQGYLYYGLHFSADGTQLFGNESGNTIHSYAVPTPFDLSSVVSAPTITSGFALSSSGLFISPDGTRVYMSKVNLQEIYQYTLSVPWDLTTAGSAVIESTTGTVLGLFFKPDGTKMFTIGFNDQQVREYNLSTPWDITTVSGVINSFTVGLNIGRDVTLSSDGTKLFVLENDVTNNLYQYTLSVPWDVSSATFDNSIDLAVAGLLGLGNNSTYSFTWNDSGTKLYVAGFGAQAIFQMDVINATPDLISHKLDLDNDTYEVSINGGSSYIEITDNIRTNSSILIAPALSPNGATSTLSSVFESGSFTNAIPNGFLPLTDTSVEIYSSEEGVELRPSPNDLLSSNVDTDDNPNFPVVSVYTSIPVAGTFRSDIHVIVEDPIDSDVEYKLSSIDAVTSVPTSILEYGTVLFDATHSQTLLNIQTELTNVSIASTIENEGAEDFIRVDSTTSYINLCSTPTTDDPNFRSLKSGKAFVRPLLETTS